MPGRDSAADTLATVQTSRINQNQVIFGRYISLAVALNVLFVWHYAAMQMREFLLMMKLADDLNFQSLSARKKAKL